MITKRKGFFYENYIDTIPNPRNNPASKDFLRSLRKLNPGSKIALHGRDPNRKRFIPILLKKGFRLNGCGGAKHFLQSDVPLYLNPKNVAVYLYPKGF